MSRRGAAAAFEAWSSPWRLRLLALLALGFVAIGAWMVGAFGPDHPSGLRAVAFGWAAIGFFGLCAIVATRRSFKRRLAIRVDGVGVYYPLWSDALIPWREIADVHSVSMQGQKMIGLELHDPSAFPGKGWQARLAGANKRLTGVDAIWLTTTGTDRKHKDLVEAIEQFRDV